MKTRLLFFITVLVLYSCGREPHGDVAVAELAPKLEPDYSEVTIPPNIAPLNFIINEKGSAYFVKFSSGKGTEIEVFSRNGIIQIPENRWRKMLQNNSGKEYKVDIYSKGEKGKWLKFKTITNKVATEPIDPYLYYRLLYPGYESWAELSINRRNLENFKAQSLIENSVADENCINCHSFNNGKTDDFLFHMRGTLGGTYFYTGGEFRKMNLKTKEMKNGAVYPRCHPSGKFVAFSSNKIIQRFHAADNKKVEVSDLESSLVLYDVGKNEIMNIELANKEKFMDTYPEWSPDGKYLYFCRAPQIGKKYDYKQIKYNLYRVPFDAGDRSFGEAELVFDAAQINKSVSFPRISPDGRFLVLTIFDFGCFPIWHKEADLYSIDLENFKVSRLDLNSNYADSYHSWSSNGKWLVFSSKRDDGLTARPYISYISENGASNKPFILPQKDPEFYKRFLKSFNIPELSTIKIDLNPGEIRKLAKTAATPAKWYKN
ncbi:MAG: cytochrome C biosynthesis protein [Bacteroidia bacterium]|nr:cytochrome C biosynthesis protein [Bacteroidia bacterium]